MTERINTVINKPNAMWEKFENQLNRRSFLRVASIAGLSTVTGCLGSVFGQSDINVPCETTSNSNSSKYIGGVGLYARNENPQTVYFVVGIKKSALNNSPLHLVLIYGPENQLLYDIPIFNNSLRPKLKADIGWIGENEAPFPIDVGSPPQYGQFRVVAKDANGRTLQIVTARSSCYVDSLH